MLDDLIFTRSVSPTVRFLFFQLIGVRSREMSVVYSGSTGGRVDTGRISTRKRVIYAARPRERRDTPFVSLVQPSKVTQGRLTSHTKVSSRVEDALLPAAGLYSNAAPEVAELFGLTGRRKY